MKNNILECIGNTPIVKLEKFSKEYNLKCNIYAKCEFFNPGGSIKDRIAKYMIEQLEAQGKLKPNSNYTIIEATSGNTGIGLALVGIIKGYNVIITMPEKMSLEKVNILKALGAKIIQTPNVSWDSPQSHINVAKRLNKEIPNSIIPDQYTNMCNPLVHYNITANEIIEQMNGKIDMIILAVGTGGTISGISKRLKEFNPNIQIIGVDPHGSILASPDTLNIEGVHPYKVEGIGYDFIPNVLDKQYIDKWIKTNDEESFLMTRKLISYGLLCGGSSGAVASATLKIAQTLNENQNCVILLPDSIRNYMTTILNEHTNFP
jgi:cystathionine beta-synthase